MGTMELSTKSGTHANIHTHGVHKHTHRPTHRVMDRQNKWLILFLKRQIYLKHEILSQTFNEHITKLLHR